MSREGYHLSKSRFTAGLQCKRQLWWRVHEPEASELQPDESLQAVFDTGNRVGERAREEFEGGVLIELDYRKTDQAVAQTRDAIDRGASPIFEACFLQDGIFVAVDVLSKQGDGWVLTEVKGTTRAKPQHIPDATVQAHVVERAGLRVDRVEVMHLNREHRHPDEGDLFERTDVTEQVCESRKGIFKEAQAQLHMLAGDLPDIQPGAHCKDPYDCPFIDRCAEPAPEHAIGDLYRIGAKKTRQLDAEGIETVDQIPSDFPLTAIQKRHRASVRRNEMIVEPGLGKTLRQWDFPIAMLDFETIGPALPVWNGCSPFGKVPVQFSVHTLDASGNVSHRAHLAEGNGDPRPAIAEALVTALQGARTILAWNAGFEKNCLSILAECVPQHRSALLEARENVEDLLPVVRNHLYHPAFHGSFSIKAVVPALLPDMAYDGFEVADGGTASAQLEQLLCRPDTVPADARPTMRDQLLAYCNHDTAVMVALFRFLHQVADSAA